MAIFYLLNIGDIYSQSQIETANQEFDYFKLGYEYTYKVHIDCKTEPQCNNCCPNTIKHLIKITKQVSDNKSMTFCLVFNLISGQNKLLNKLINYHFLVRTDKFGNFIEIQNWNSLEKQGILNKNYICTKKELVNTIAQISYYYLIFLNDNLFNNTNSSVPTTIYYDDQYIYDADLKVSLENKTKSEAVFVVDEQPIDLESIKSNHKPKSIQRISKYTFELEKKILSQIEFYQKIDEDNSSTISTKFIELKEVKKSNKEY